MADVSTFLDCTCVRECHDNRLISPADSIISCRLLKQIPASSISSQVPSTIIFIPNPVDDRRLFLQVQAGEAYAQAGEQTVQELLDQSKQIIDHHFQGEQQARQGGHKWIQRAE